MTQDKIAADRYDNVGLTTAIKLESRLEGDALLRGGCLGVCRLSSIESIDIGLMMLLVVKLHDLTADEWLKGIIAVRKIRESVLAGHVQLMVVQAVCCCG
jgi:hypothetical protein